LLVRADRVDIVMDATDIWPHRVCTALCARTGWCRAADTRVHATTTNDKNNGVRVYRTRRTYETTNKQTNKQTNKRIQRRATAVAMVRTSILTFNGIGMSILINERGEVGCVLVCVVFFLFSLSYFYTIFPAHSPPTVRSATYNAHAARARNVALSPSHTHTHPLGVRSLTLSDAATLRRG